MGRRGTFLVLMGAFAVTVALAVPVLAQGAAPSAPPPGGVPEPVAPVAAGTAPPGTTSSASPSSPAPSSAAPSSTSRTPAPNGMPTMPAEDGGQEFRAVAGPDCPEDATVRVRVSGAPGAAGWQESRGGQPGEGCGDRFLYVDPGYASDNHVQWLFTFDAPAARSCRIEVHVPDSPHASAIVWYDIADRFDDIEYGIGDFTVDQEAFRGQWVDAAAIQVDTAALLVHVDGHDQDLAPDRTGVAAGAMRVSCTNAEL